MQSQSSHQIILISCFYGIPSFSRILPQTNPKPQVDAGDNFLPLVQTITQKKNLKGVPPSAPLPAQEAQFMRIFTVGSPNKAKHDLPFIFPLAYIGPDVGQAVVATQLFGMQMEFFPLSLSLISVRGHKHLVQGGHAVSIS